MNFKKFKKKALILTTGTIIALSGITNANAENKLNYKNHLKCIPNIVQIIENRNIERIFVPFWELKRSEVIKFVNNLDKKEFKFEGEDKAYTKLEEAIRQNPYGDKVMFLEFDLIKSKIVGAYYNDGTKFLSF